MQQRILSVQDFSCLGKCSNTVALPVLSALGHECVILPTALLSTHTGIKGCSFFDLTDEMRRILDHWTRMELHFDAVLTGYFGSPEQLSMVRDYLDGKTLFRFVDPVLGDNGSLYDIYTEDFVHAMRDFCHGADVITPNVTEACMLTGLPYPGDHYDEAAMEQLLQGLLALDVKRVVLTGVRFSETEIGVLTVEPGKTPERYVGPYEDTYFPGTGDTLAATLCGKLVAGLSFDQAIRETLDFVYRSIQDTLPTNIRYGLCFEQELQRI